MNSDRRADSDNHCAEIANYYSILSFAAIQETFTNGQIKPKAVRARHRFFLKSYKRMCFLCHEKQKSKQNAFVHSFFVRIYRASIYFWSFLTFTELEIFSKSNSTTEITLIVVNVGLPSSGR